MLCITSLTDVRVVRRMSVSLSPVFRPTFLARLHERRCAVQNLEREDMLSRFGTEESFPLASVLLVA